MNNRTLFWMTAFVLVGISALLAINTMKFIDTKGTTNRVPRETVKGMAVFHDGKPYTLNFAQQNSLIDFLNAAKPISLENVPDIKNATGIEKIVIYHFTGADTEIFPLSYTEQGNLRFSVPLWHPNTLEDSSNGALKSLLTSTVDQ
ncbi:MAG: hypothetical protein H0X51_09170 [Parachlamydiaceae bacterium]|nr:hypothetical protein [Parachlamydiaceae bacterium]